MKKEKAMVEIQRIAGSFNNKEFAEILDEAIGNRQLEDIIRELSEINQNYVLAPYWHLEHNKTVGIQLKVLKLQEALEFSQQEFAKAINLREESLLYYQNNYYKTYPLGTQLRIIKTFGLKREYFYMPDYEEYLSSIADKLAKRAIRIKKSINKNKKKGDKNEQK